MLVLARRSEESILIGDNIEVVILEIRGNVARIGIKAPREISVLRSEIRKIAVTQNDQRTKEETSGVLRGMSPITALNEIGVQLLHDFCERRKAFRPLSIDPSA